MISLLLKVTATQIKLFLVKIDTIIRAVARGGPRLGKNKVHLRLVIIVSVNLPQKCFSLMSVGKLASTPPKENFFATP